MKCVCEGGGGGQNHCEKLSLRVPKPLYLLGLTPRRVREACARFQARAVPKPIQGGSRWDRARPPRLGGNS